jgi:hypothetical protein
MAFTKTFLVGSRTDIAAQNDRLMGIGAIYIEGVAPAFYANATEGDPQQACRVKQQSSPSLGVTIQAGRVFVRGDDTDYQGIYQDYNDGDFPLANPFGPPSGAGQQRIDLVVARINDSEHTTNATPAPDSMAFAWVQGTPNTSASISEYDPVSAPWPADWPTLPPSSLLLAAVELHTGDTSIVDSRILDMRRLAGPAIWGEDGNVYRLFVSASGMLGIENVKGLP